MKNKKGFTLIEIMVTIAIIALLVALGIGVYIGLGARSRERLFETKVGVIETAAEKWGEDFDLRDPLVITVNRLVLDGYIQADEDGGKIIDPRDSEEMNCDKIEILIQDNGYVARYIGLLEGESEGEACDLMQKEIADPSIQMTAYKVTNENGIETEEDITDKIKSGELPWVNTDVRLKATYNWNTEDNPDNSAATNPLLLVKWWQNTTQLRELEERVSESNPVIENGFEHTITTPLSINTPFQISVTTGMDGVKSRRVQVKIDKISPDVPIVDAPDNWVNGTREIVIKSNDRESGIAKYEYALTDPYTTEEVWQQIENVADEEYERKIEFNFDPSKILKPDGQPLGEGQHSVWFKVTDEAGNSSMTGQGDETIFKFDTTPPTCDWSGENTTWTNQDRTITLTCNDGGGSPCHRDASGGSKTFSTTTQTSNMSYIIIDLAGNLTTCAKRANVYVDKTPPVCTYNDGGYYNNWTNQNRTVNIGCTDANSKCHTSYDSYSRTFTTTTQTAAVSYTIRDNAGNATTCAKTANVYVDKIPPVCTYDDAKNYNNWTKYDRTVNIGCTDANSKCHTSYDSYSRTFTTTTQTAAIGYTIRDNAGNAVWCGKTANVYVDKTPPTCSWSGGSTAWTSGSRTITASCHDYNSGCRAGYAGGSSYFNHTTWTANLGYTLMDNAGNSSWCSTTANVFVDKHLPEIRNDEPYGRWYDGSTATAVGTDYGSQVWKYQYRFVGNSTKTGAVVYDTGWLSSYNTWYVDPLAKSNKECETRYVAQARAIDNAGNYGPVRELNSYTTGTCCKSIYTTPVEVGYIGDFCEGRYKGIKDYKGTWVYNTTNPRFSHSTKEHFKENSRWILRNSVQCSKTSGELLNFKITIDGGFPWTSGDLHVNGGTEYYFVYIHDDTQYLTEYFMGTSNAGDHPYLLPGMGLNEYPHTAYCQTDLSNPILEWRKCGDLGLEC